MKQQSLCTICSIPINKGKYCLTCARQHKNDVKQAYRAKQRKEGKCINCGKPTKWKSCRCSVCALKQNNYFKTKIEKRKQNNLCIICNNPLTNSKPTCENCKANKAEYEREYRKKINLLVQELMKDEIILCLQCQQPMDKTGKYCSSCTKLRNVTNRNNYNNINKKKGVL